MNLLLDIGNTRLKWGVDYAGELKKTAVVEYKKTDFLHSIQQSWTTLDSPQVLAISAVSTAPVQQIVGLASQLWPDIKILMAQSSASGFSVTNAYQQAEQLGVDRWLGLIAVHHYYPNVCCVVDCGTALTIDCINSDGQHLGGLISPGLMLMRQSLAQGTAHLPFSEKRSLVGLASDTESAIYSGSLYAAVGLIEKVINKLCPCQTPLITGGDATLLVNYLDFKVLLEPDLVLKGLSLFVRGESMR